MKKGIYILLAVLMSYSSCKKKEETPPPPTAPAVLKSVSQMPGGLSTTYSYNGDGKLERMQFSDGTSTSISYSGDTVIETNYNDSAQKVSCKILLLNLSGLAENSFLTDTLGTVLSRTIYNYDTAKFKISERIYDGFNNQVAHKEWAINDVNIYYHNSSDSLTAQNNAEFHYGFDYEKKNTIGNSNMGLEYYGRSTENLIISLDKRSGFTGNTFYSYKYTFDMYGRIETQSAYKYSGEFIHTNTYTYN